MIEFGYYSFFLSLLTYLPTYLLSYLFISFPFIYFIHNSRYGRIREIDLKTPHRPPAFAFITFDDHRDADDAIRG